MIPLQLLFSMLCIESSTIKLDCSKFYHVSAIGGQNRTKGAFGGGLTRKFAVNAEHLRGNYTLVVKNRQKIRPKRPKIDI